MNGRDASEPTPEDPIPPPATRPLSASDLRLIDLLHAVEDESDVLVLTHDNPDPDSLASAAALATLLKRAGGINPVLAFGGIVGRAENRALIQELGIDFERIESMEVPASMPIALVDTQPRSGNNSLPAGRIASIVVDHHPPRPDSTAATFTDIRPDYGASCSMMVEYLRAAGIEPDRTLATALFYGIQSETMDLGRETAPADVEASIFLYPLSDPAALSRIRYARVPPTYFRALYRALAAATRYRGVVVAPLGRLDYPDMVAEIADLLLQMAGIEWTIAIGQYRDRLLLSLRTRANRAHAGRLVREAIGDRGSAGGHGSFAGGQVPVRGLDDDQVTALAQEITDEILGRLEVDRAAAEPLVSEALPP